jgi:hypothetical protein
MKPDERKQPPFPVEPIDPDLLAWARQTFNEEEFLAELREVEATGGVHFEDFIDEVKKAARGK